MASENLPNGVTPRSARPFRQAVLRGLAVILPPLLTIALFLWAWSLVQHYVLDPVESMVRTIVVTSIHDVIPKDIVDSENLTVDKERTVFTRNDSLYVVLPSTGEGIPLKVANRVSRLRGGDLNLNSATADECFDNYARTEYLKPILVVPVFLCVFIILLYLLGKILAAGVGRFIWSMIERAITRVPVIRNVYSSVKQVTDFIFTDREVTYTQVVAVQYPRKGVWSIGFVTGEGMSTIHQRTQEPMLSLLMPTSPMPATGFIITVPRSETIDLDITIDQAIQFVVSCGVVVPIGERHSPGVDGSEEIQKLIEQSVQGRDEVAQHDAASGTTP
jgi:uncharacterized membrane protein